MPGPTEIQGTGVVFAFVNARPTNDDNTGS